MRKSLFKLSFLLIPFYVLAPGILVAGFFEQNNPTFKAEQITDDVAIVGKVPDDVCTVIDAILHPIRYKRAGAPLPKGILMLGAPGTGKTTMARLIAKNTGSPIIFTSAAQFINTFIGTGPAAVRQLFTAANDSLKDQEAKQRRKLERDWWENEQKKNPDQPGTTDTPDFKVEVKPVIIFIDEIDSIACNRAGLQAGGGDQELRNTLNELFQQMEGAKSNNNIIIIAATNEDEGFLDPAFRSRFTYIAHVALPQAADRREILRFYSANCTFSTGVSLDYLSGDEYTAGYSGRDLKKLVEHIARVAASDKRFKDEEVAINFEHVQKGHSEFAERKRLEAEAVSRRRRGH